MASFSRDVNRMKIQASSPAKNAAADILRNAAKTVAGNSLLGGVGAALNNVRNDIATPAAATGGALDYYQAQQPKQEYAPLKQYGSFSDESGRGAWANIAPDVQTRAGEWYNNGNPMYYASLNLPDNVNIPDAYKAVNTPVGAFEFGTNDGNPGVYADYQPNNYYIQALANLLSGR